MESVFSEQKYSEIIEGLFQRFPSFQKAGASAYKPGIAGMEFIDSLMGHPHGNYNVIHVAGTNGKGSVSNMLASVLSACGLKVGLYTSPHILDFRERMKVIGPTSPIGRDDRTVIPGEPEGQAVACCIPKEYVYDFVCRWQETFDHLDLSFFEITTIMALQWFADENVDLVVLETGLGGRLDSTNIVTPVLSVITNIGLDHCDMLGDTLPEIAFEKAGIIKPGVPVVVGESHPETDPVFERKVLYTNLPGPKFMGSRTAVMSLLTFADKMQPQLWDDHEVILSEMDLQGEYQRKNLRTVLAALDVLTGIRGTSEGELHAIPSNFGVSGAFPMENCAQYIRDAIVSTARRTGFRGRWEKLSDDPLTICDIGHNEHGLRHNFAQLERMHQEGGCSELIIVYGSVADKDVEAVLHLMPADATYIFTQAQSRRALAARDIYEKFVSSGRDDSRVYVRDKVCEALELARSLAAKSKEENPQSRPLVYVGGSTYVVSEAVTL